MPAWTSSPLGKVHIWLTSAAGSGRRSTQASPRIAPKQLLPPRRPVDAGAAEVAPLQASNTLSYSHKKVTVTNYQIKFTGPLQSVNDLLKNQNCCL